MANSEHDQNGWHIFWQGILGQIFNVHFFITLLVLIFWVYSLSAPLKSLVAVQTQLSTQTIAMHGGDIAQFQAEREASDKAIDSILKSAVAVSGLFTTVLGLVLGHYFGQRGQEKALQDAEISQKARAEAEAKSKIVAEGSVEAATGSAEAVAATEAENERLWAGLNELVELLPAATIQGLPENSSLRMLIDPDDAGEGEE